MDIVYRRGDATRPDGLGPRVIVHVCNDTGGWGRGFVVALSARWPQPEGAYRRWYRTGLSEGVPFGLGQVLFVPVADDDGPTWVANLVGQHDVKMVDGMAPVRYEAIRLGLGAIRDFCQAHKASVHAPRFGAGLAGGDWDVIEEIIIDELADQGVAVTIYDLA